VGPGDALHSEEEPGQEPAQSDEELALALLRLGVLEHHSDPASENLQV
jgi:hypothetical protein